MPPGKNHFPIAKYSEWKDVSDGVSHITDFIDPKVYVCNILSAHVYRYVNKIVFSLSL